MIRTHVQRLVEGRTLVSGLLLAALVAATLLFARPAHAETFTVQFFSNPSADPSEGKTLVGQKKVTTNRRGKASFVFVAPEQVSVEENHVTATATGSGGTSEFSVPVPVSRD